MTFCQSGARQYLPLCSIPTQMSRDGYAGTNAHIYLPWYHNSAGFTYYFFSGKQVAFPNGSVPQDGSRLLNGRNLPVASVGKGFTCDGPTGCGA